MNRKNVHIAYIITKLELGGAQKVCLSLFHGISPTGYTPHLISGTQGPLVSTVQNHKNVYLFDSMTREISFIKCFQELRNIIQLIYLLYSLRKKYPSLIVHTHSTKAGLIGRWAAFFARVSVRVHTIHGYSFHAYQSRLGWYSMYLLELITSFITTHFICVSTIDAKTGTQLFPHFARKHSLIRAAVDMQHFYQPATLDKVTNQDTFFIFGTISCFKPQKNLLDLLEAFKKVHQKAPLARLEIIGDGIERTKIENWMSNHHLQDRITLHGWQTNVLPFMQKWHAFALSSLWEGLPCAVIEARLLQLPVISYDVGGISEVIMHEKNGLLCPAKNSDLLSHNMHRTLSDKNLYQKMQKYPDNLADFNAHVMVQNHKALYKKLLTPS